ncbi:hypothetical protein SO802_012537 [Lithocarpus litseifolius]|uniref:Uncharacterized protein n=1 Tax=Lithocarpus litseifolius TaxID=425828 RepID=A0AAW2D3R7_9ROSI
MAAHKHRNAVLEALTGKEVSLETTPQEVLSIMGVEAVSCPSLPFSDEEIPPEVATHTRFLQITIECISAKVPMVLIDNGSALNVLWFRTTFKVGLDIETIIPSPLTVKA